MSIGRFTSANATAPAHGARAVTPADGTDLANGVCRALYIGTTGNVNLITADGDTVLFTAVPVGILPIQCQRVLSTSTTASTIVALY